MGRADRIRRGCDSAARRPSSTSSRAGFRRLCRTWRRAERPRRRADGARDRGESSAAEVGFAQPMITRRFFVPVLLLVMELVFPALARAQSEGHEEWVEEPAAIVEGEPGHSYLDPASTRRGDDGLVYFNESTGVTKPDEIGHKGFMKNAYD